MAKLERYLISTAFPFHVLAAWVTMALLWTWIPWGGWWTFS